MHHPIDRIAHIMAFVTPVVEHWLEQEIAIGSTMKDRSDVPSHHECTLLPWSYYRLRGGSRTRCCNWLLNYVGSDGPSFVPYFAFVIELCNSW